MRRRTDDPTRPPRAIAVPAESRRRFVLLGAAVAALLALLAHATLTRAEETRTLDEVEIEGEVRLPQVLFITSREADRPLDWLDTWSGPTAADIASGAWASPRIHLLSPVTGMPAVDGEGETGAPADSENEPIDSNQSPSATEEDLR